MMRRGYFTAIVPMAIVLSNDILRKHLANRCEKCHPEDCWICARARGLNA